MLLRVLVLVLWALSSLLVSRAALAQPTRQGSTTIVPNAVIRSDNCPIERVIAPLCEQITPSTSIRTVFVAVNGQYELFCLLSGGAGSCGSGMALSGTPDYLSMFNPAGDTVIDSAIGTAILGGGTEASVLFLGPGGVVSQDNTPFQYITASNTLQVDHTSVLTDIWRGATSGTLTHTPAATTTDYILTWPAAVGTTGQVLQLANGTGTLEFATPSGGGTGCVPAGSDGEILYAVAGECESDTALTYDPVANNLHLNFGVAGGSGAGVFALGAGTAPTSAPTGSVQLYSESLLWTDIGNTDAGLGITILSVDGFIDPAPMRYHLGQQMIIGSNLENTHQTTGLVIDNRDLSGEFLCFKESGGGVAHGIFPSFLDTDIAGCIEGGSGGGLAFDSYGGQFTGYRFDAIVTEEQAQTDGFTAGPFVLTARLKSGSTAVSLSNAKELFALRRGTTSSTTPSLDDTVFSVNSHGDLQVRGILYMDSHGDGGIGSSYGGLGVGYGAYIHSVSNLFLLTEPNLSDTSGSGTVGTLGLWTDDVTGFTPERAILWAGSTNVSTQQNPLGLNHVYFYPVQSLDNGAGDRSDKMGFGFVTEDGTRIFLGDGFIGGDRVLSGTAQSLIIKSESGQIDTTNQNAGTLTLSSGRATGSGTGAVEIHTTTAGASGTADRLPTAKWRIRGNGDILGLTTAHVIHGGSAPTVSPTNCGTSPTIAGRDEGFRVTVDATASLSCVVTFAVAFTNAPACVANNETTGNLLRATATTTTVTLIGVTVSGDTLTAVCRGYE